MSMLTWCVFLFARYLDSFIHCCYASAAVPGLQCDSPGDEFSSCDDLMKNWALRACLWVLGISAILGNIAVIILRTIMEKERRDTTQGRERRGTRPGQERRVQPFLLINLAVSDFLMGIYLLIIAIKDAQWQGEYFKHDFDWRAGSVCQLAGALSMLSSEVSVVMLTLITFDRLVCVVFPFSNARLTSRKAYDKPGQTSRLGVFCWLLHRLEPFRVHLHSRGVHCYILHSTDICEKSRIDENESGRSDGAEDDVYRPHRLLLLDAGDCDRDSLTDREFLRSKEISLRGHRHLRIASKLVHQPDTVHVLRCNRQAGAGEHCGTLWCLLRRQV